MTESPMKSSLAILAALSLGALTQPAVAQSVSASKYKTTLAFATCIVDAKADQARAVFTTAPKSPESDASVAALVAGTNCGDPGVAGALRGALAERVYLKTYAAAPTEVSLTPATFTGSGNPALANYDVTRCAALRDPVGADMLVRAELRSDAEKAAIKRIVPVIGACTPAGGQIGFDREGMRGLVAEGLIAVRQAPGGN